MLQRLQQHRRSLLGAVIVLALLPVLLVQMACLPFPVGDPERAAIDDELTGIWVGFWEGNKASEPTLIIFEAYDPRTWLVGFFGLETKAGIAPQTEADAASLLARIRQKQVQIDKQIFFKAWQTDIGDRQFLVWEPRLELHGEGRIAATTWYLFATQKVAPQRLKLGFTSVEKAQTAEEVVTRIVNEQDTETLWMDWERVPADTYAAVHTLLTAHGFEY